MFHQASSHAPAPVQSGGQPPLKSTIPSSRKNSTVSSVTSPGCTAETDPGPGSPPPAHRRARMYCSRYFQTRGESTRQFVNQHDDRRRYSADRKKCRDQRPSIQRHDPPLPTRAASSPPRIRVWIFISSDSSFPTDRPATASRAALPGSRLARPAKLDCFPPLCAKMIGAATPMKSTPPNQVDNASQYTTCTTRICIAARA